MLPLAPDRINKYRYRTACAPGHNPEIPGTEPGSRRDSTTANDATTLRPSSITPVATGTARSTGPETVKRWLEARRQELLPVGYPHVVFTLPHQPSQLAMQNKKLVYSLLVRTAAEMLARAPPALAAA